MDLSYTVLDSFKEEMTRKSIYTAKQNNEWLYVNKITEELSDCGD